MKRIRIVLVIGLCTIMSITSNANTFLTSCELPLVTDKIECEGEKDIEIILENNVWVQAATKKKALEKLTSAILAKPSAYGVKVSCEGCQAGQEGCQLGVKSGSFSPKVISTSKKNGVIKYKFEAGTYPSKAECSDCTLNAEAESSEYTSLSESTIECEDGKEVKVVLKNDVWVEGTNKADAISKLTVAIMAKPDAYVNATCKGCQAEQEGCTLSMDEFTPESGGFSKANDVIKYRFVAGSYTANAKCSGCSLSEGEQLIDKGIEYHSIDQLKNESYVNDDLTSEDDESFSVYPNPAAEDVFIDVMIDKEVHYYLTVRNSSGQQVSKKGLGVMEKGKHLLTFSVGEFEPGIYLISCESKEGQVGSVKLIVQ